MRLLRLGPALHAVEDLARREQIEARLARHETAVRREDARDVDEVELRDPGVPERQLEARELLPRATDTLRQEDLPGHESRRQPLLFRHHRPPLPDMDSDVRGHQKTERRGV
jgi:hypothetical protein